MQRCRWETARERGGKLAFLFTGQGSAAARHGSGAAGIDVRLSATRSKKSAATFDELLDMPLRVVLFAEEGSEAAAKLDETAYTQPALFAVEVALFRQLESVGRRARHPVGAFHRRARRGSCGGCVVAERGVPSGGGAWPVDAGACPKAER